MYFIYLFNYILHFNHSTLILLFYLSFLFILFYSILLHFILSHSI